MNRLFAVIGWLLLGFLLGAAVGIAGAVYFFARLAGGLGPRF